jgi:succinate dehydrogenase hydrophobic anchor subunit
VEPVAVLPEVVMTVFWTVEKGRSISRVFARTVFMRICLLLFCLVSSLHAGSGVQWTWKDGTGRSETKSEFDALTCLN